MLPSETKHTPSGQPTGDLEHLFRQKFAEAEVAPRANLWEQIDHNLVVGQNETFRRRLLVYRWVAAASVLLLVGFGSWFGLRYGILSGAPELAARTAAPATNSASRADGATPAGASEQLALGLKATGASAETAGTAPIGSSAAAGYSSVAAQATGTTSGTNSATANGAELTSPGASFLDAALQPEAAYSAVAYSATNQTIGSSRFASAAESAGDASHNALNGQGMGVNGLLARAAALQGGVGYGRPSYLPQTALAVSATATASLNGDEAQEETPARPRRWRLLGSYAASSFSPNIDFSRPGSSAVMARGVKSLQPSSSEVYAMAADEYRRELRAGLSQRVALTASYAAGKHWSLATGLEVAEQRASSRTSYYFLDGKSASADVAWPSVDPSLNQPRQLPSHRTDYRYRTAGIPVSARYGQTKTGLSMYAKVGAVVNVLLNSRSELEGSPEATREYSLTSSDSPYRHLQMAVRGGAGARYQPAHATWSVAVGPTAETGLTTLNADPNQSLTHRSRPYSVGLEASVEFGAKPVLAP
ncbi:hypothetical protein [Hymenobacter persicinus]|uniref:Outer membrane protein beta-barrel domain-containing protein n=1 Tax=Hymenobacter persicinus TaxID=2025506 RepID=A0A4Q5LA84_9BACT|nr:hypothetical protein [Hymenobacter persicinus]RYU78790.1 hypothetical protein EWM57_12735 [Hymenobacter persicinus]